MNLFKYSIVLIILFAQIAQAQVGVGTTNPNATLDIRSSNQATPNNTDGILIPKVDEFPSVNPTINQDGMLIFVTGNGTPVKGFYYWDDAQNSWISATGVKRINDLIDGKSDTNGTFDGSSIFLGVDSGLNDDGTDNRNIGIGYQSLNSVTSGPFNIGLGYQSQYSLTTGVNNVATGYRSLYSNTAGNGNVSVGNNTLYSNTTGDTNIAFGNNALFSNTEGNNNLANGNLALYSNTTGNENIAFGFQSLNNNDTGSNNIAHGTSALFNNTSGFSNIAIGGLALNNNTSGNNNIAYGINALSNNLTGNENIASGSYALRNSTIGNNNLALGYYSGYSNITGTHNVFIGSSSGYDETGSNKLYIENTDADANNALIYGEFDNDILRTNGQFQIGNPTLTGYAFPTADGAVNQILQSDGSGNLNWVDSNLNIIHSINDLIDGKSDADGTDDGSSLFLGIDAGLNDDESANYNVGIGYNSLLNNIDGNGNTAIGSVSLYSNITGDSNVAIGMNSLQSNTAGNYNVSIGNVALFSNTTGHNNVASGSLALRSNTTGQSNVANGFSSMFNNSMGNYNLANGSFALYDNSSGNQNTANGAFALSINTTGNNNVAIGYLSLNGNTTGNNNIALGSFSGRSANGDNNLFLGYQSAGNPSPNTKYGSIFIGYQSGFFETASNRLYIENTNADAANALIYGEFDNDILAFNANVGIGMQTPEAKLHVVEDGTSGVQTIVAGISSDVSNRPVLQFSETSALDLASGMSLEYNGVGLAGENRMIFNGLGGNPLFEFRNDGNLIALNGRIGVQTALPTCAVEINHPLGIANEGLKLTNQVDTDAWRFYVQWNTNLLSLLYNNVNVGNFDNVSGVYTAISDRNLKTNISNLPSVLEKIQNLEVVDYNFKFQSDSKKYVGLIAQDVEAVFPHLVAPPNEESENYTMDYSGFGVLAIKAIQEQQEEISNLKSQLLSQQEEINNIKETVKKLLAKE